jgi:hypothetical protein
MAGRQRSIKAVEHCFNETASSSQLPRKYQPKKTLLEKIYDRHCCHDQDAARTAGEDPVQGLGEGLHRFVPFHLALFKVQIEDLSSRSPVRGIEVRL